MTRKYLSIISLAVVLSSFAIAKGRRAEGSLTVDLPASYETAVQVVSEIAADGTIRGTAQYQTESQITDAQPATSSSLLTPEPIPGASYFYKIRSTTLSPRHYKDSNDVGTLVVAYTLEKVSEEKSRLTIESVFVPDSHHGRSASDGSVETCEFTAIEARLKTLELAKQQARQREETEQQQVRIRTLRRQLAEEQSHFDALKAEVQQLQKRSMELRNLCVAKAKSSAVRLQVAPYARSQVLQALTEGEELDVLYKTSNWYRVRTSGGTIGWVYASLLEPVQ
jgi:polyhydroxyalkanoate synthesis regulator phasin